MTDNKFILFENEVINYWKSNNIYEELKKNREHCKKWEFLDGPPFVNGTPHYGHLLVSSIKDTIARYMLQKNYKISYQIGFDCHGLPLEQEAEKKCGKVSINDDIKQIKLFNNTCRDIIKDCSLEWYNILERLGRQFDKSETYYTSDIKYMETLWWSFKKLWDKDLIYISKKVMPYSPLCETPLSNFEANSNYQERTDISVYVKFKIINIEEYLLIWTTTPWSLFGNQGICVNPEFKYNLVDINNEKIWICEDFNNKFNVKIIYKTVYGKELENIKYIPIFNFIEIYNESCFKVYCDNYVDNKNGTGIVHLAPLFGEDDLRVMKNKNYIDNLLPEYLVNSKIRFNIHFIINNQDIYNNFVMDTNTNIVIYLKNNNIAILSEKIKHNYPYCWRTDYPLIYLATNAWFINVKKLTPQLIENNKKIEWYPKYIGSERFGNWIKDAHDWCISRNRLWGTPLPLWINDKGDIKCIGSIQELEELTNKKINDIHIDEIYNLTFETTEGIYKRTFGVLDCWYESGMAGLARYGYPECKNKTYPVDFIAESLDQTRGWFYTLNVLSTALNDTYAFKKVIVSGLILAEDGKKMSKRLNNYTSPNIIIETYGVDVLRLYLIGSPACKAESYNFKEIELLEITKKIILYYNAHNLYNDYINNAYNKYNKFDFVESTNKLDIWIKNEYILKCLKIYNLMENLELVLIPNIIYKYIDNICNIYIKLSRERMKGTNKTDVIESLSTLYWILNNTNLLLGPFIPHLSEYFNLMLKNNNSIHLKLIDFNYINNYKINNDILSSFNSVNELIETVRNLRLKVNIAQFIPLDYIELYTNNNNILDYTDIICQELNIKKIILYSTENINRNYKPNKGVLGKKYKKDAIKYINLIEKGEINNIDNEDYYIEYIIENKNNMIVSKFDYIDNNNNINQSLVYLYTKISPENLLESELNNIRRQINEIRKNLKLKLYNKINLYFENNDFWKELEEKNNNLLKNFINKLSCNVIFENKLLEYDIINTYTNKQIKYHKQIIL